MTSRHPKSKDGVWPLNVMKALETAWDEAAKRMKRCDDELVDINPYWSEADLVFRLAKQLQSELEAEGSKDLVVHVSPFLIADEDLFGNLTDNIAQFMTMYKKERHKKKTKAAPDIVVHKSDNVDHLYLCAEVKYFLGTNYWESKLESVRDDVLRTKLYRKAEVCDQVAMLVAFSRQAGSDKQKKELTSILDEYEGELKQKKERHVLLLRYNC